MLAFLDWLTFDNFVKVLRDGAVTVYEWFRDLVWALLSVVFEPVHAACASVAAFIGTMASSLGVLSSYLAFANAWVPVDLFFQCVGAYSALWLALTIYRNVKSWIPTVSGS